MKNNKLITFMLSTLFIVTSVLCSLVLAGVLEFNSGTPLSFAFAEMQSEPQEPITEDTMFLIDLEFVRVFGDDVYIYDKADKTIKIVDRKTNSFKEENNRFKNLNLKDLIVYNDVLMMFSNNNSFSCVNLNNLEEVIFDTTGLTTISSAKYIKQITISGVDYLLLCPESPTTENFEIATLNKNDDGEVVSLTLTNISTFKLEVGFESTIPSYNDIYITEYESNIFLMMVTETNIYSFNVNPTDVKAEYSNITSVTGFEENQTILNISNITLNDGTETISVTTDSSINFYNIAISIDAVSLTKLADKSISLDSSLVPTSASGQGSAIALISNTNQSLKIYNFDDDNQSVVESELRNQELSVVTYTPSEFKYILIKEGTSLPILNLPYSKDNLTIANGGEHLVVIGEGQDQSQTSISGWYYVMYTNIEGENFYGYVLGINTLELEDVAYDRQFATVLPYTRLFSLPSTTSDDKNLVLTTIPANSRLEIVDELNDYMSNNQKYLLVKVNGETVGFIERSRIINVKDFSERIIPNATVMRNNSKIFRTASNNTYIGLSLNKGHRVKVIGKRDTVSNFTKITFNDEDGNEYVGYIHTHNLEPDSWTMLQIIGTILILINIILLAIIIILKNKLTR